MSHRTFFSETCLRALIVLPLTLGCGSTEPSATATPAAGHPTSSEVRPVSVSQVQSTTTNLEGDPLDLTVGVTVGQKFRVKVRYELYDSNGESRASVDGRILYLKNGKRVTMQGTLGRAHDLGGTGREVELEFEAFERPGEYEIELAGDGFLLDTLPLKIVP